MILLASSSPWSEILIFYPLTWQRIKMSNRMLSGRFASEVHSLTDKASMIMSMKLLLIPTSYFTISDQRIALFIAYENSVLLFAYQFFRNFVWFLNSTHYNYFGQEFFTTAPSYIITKWRIFLWGGGSRSLTSWKLIQIILFTYVQCICMHVCVYNTHKEKKNLV